MATLASRPLNRSGYIPISVPKLPTAWFGLKTALSPANRLSAVQPASKCSLNLKLLTSSPSSPPSSGILTRIDKKSIILLRNSWVWEQFLLNQYSCTRGTRVSLKVWKLWWSKNISNSWETSLSWSHVETKKALDPRASQRRQKLRIYSFKPLSMRKIRNRADKRMAKTRRKYPRKILSSRTCPNSPGSCTSWISRELTQYFPTTFSPSCHLQWAVNLRNGRSWWSTVAVWECRLRKCPLSRSTISANSLKTFHRRRRRAWRKRSW